jgi:hypothetical protein
MFGWLAELVLRTGVIRPLSERSNVSSTFSAQPGSILTVRHGPFSASRHHGLRWSNQMQTVGQNGCN